MAFSYVQSAQTYTAGTTLSSFPVVSPGNVTAGNLLYANVILHNTASQTISGISDTQGNIWTPCESAQSVTWSSNTYWIQSWYAVAKTTGANTVTATASAAASFSGLAVSEYAPGGSGTWTLDQVATSVENATLHLITGPQVTTVQTNVAVIGVLFDGNSAGWSTSGVWTMRMPATNLIQTAIGLVDQLNVGAGSYSPAAAQSSQAAGTANCAGTSHTFYLVLPPSVGAKVGQPTPGTETNATGYSLPITSPTVLSRAGQPTPIVFTDPNGNEYTVTGSTKGSFIVAPIPVVLCNINGLPIVPPIVITSNGNSVTISSTLTGIKLGQPTPIVLTDANGNTQGLSGFSYGTLVGNPTPFVLCDINGNPISLTLAT
jgi:hypothetical protein